MPSLPLPPWKIAIIGSGAVGSYYGARLAAAGHDVHFLFRSELEHVKQHGLDVRSYLGDLILPSVNAHGSTKEIGVCDLVIIALKTTSNSALESLIPPLLGDGTKLLTLQNGLGNEAFLAARWGAERVKGGLCFTCINRTGPGTVNHSAQGLIVVGEFARPADAGTETLAAEFNRSGIQCQVAPSLEWMRWKKLSWNFTFNGLTIIAGGVDTYAILNNPPLYALANSIMEEVIAAAEKVGYKQDADLLEYMMKETHRIPAYRPSSMIDFVEGRAVEVEAIWGEPVRQAKAAGANCAQMEMLYQLIQAAILARK